MATYRNIHISFWTDAKVVDDFTPEDRYFYLYLMTNPHTNLCGCYELSFKSASDETGYTKETIERLISRLENVHGVIRYSKDTKELLIVKWSDYNWTNSPKFRKPLYDEIMEVKNIDFREFLMDVYDNPDTVPIPYEYGSDTTVSVSVSDSVSVSVSDTDKKRKEEKKKPERRRYGEYKHVLLSDTDIERLKEKYGEEKVKEYIRKVDEYCQQKGRTYSDYNLTIQKWIRDEKPQKRHDNGSAWEDIK